jgi:uncharacterized protein
MELTNEFHVNVPLARAWDVLTNVELIAPCLPGAQLEEIEGNEYRGGVKIKVGPITAQYKGKATFLSKDDTSHIAVLRAEGRDTKGQGNAAATITATLVSSGTGTDVKVVTDLTITGKVAQFGRGVLDDVSKKLLGQFVNCLEHDVLVRPEETLSAVATASAAAPAAAATAAASTATSTTSTSTTTAAAGTTTSAANAPTVLAKDSASPADASANGSASDAPKVRKIEYKAAEPVDLLDAAGTPVIKRAAPVAIAVALLIWLFRSWRNK